jgi:hypothetical protein
MNVSLQKGALDSEEKLEEFLDVFFCRALPKAEWTHAAHVTLAASLLYDADVKTVLPRVRQAIRSHNEAVGTENSDSSGYHETLTIFWLRVVADKLKEEKAASRLDAVRSAVAAFGEERALHTLYYSTDVVKDSVARREWVEPDLRRLP